MPGTKALNVRMNFQVDTTQARQQLQGLSTQLNQITSASGFSRNSQLGITQEIMQATKAAGQLKTALAEAINPLTGNLNLSKFNDQLIASKMSLSDYRQQLSALGVQGNQTFNSLARSIMTAETPLLRTGKAAQQMWTVLGNTVRWQATSSLLHGIMGTASQAMSYVKNLDSSLNSIRIVTGQNADQMSRFAAQANKAAKELNTSTNEYAKASLIYYQQGLSNKQVEERTRTTIKLANVAGQSAKTVSDQMTAIWNNFYDGGKSIEYYADVITALGASTASSSEEIAKGLAKFSSIAKTTGLSYEYATSALSTVVAATRQSADSVGTSFKTLFSRLQGLSLGETLEDGTTLNKYSKALQTVGVNIKQANGDLKTMDTILDELGSKWKSLAQDEKVALAQTVGGARNYSGLMSLMDNWDSFQTNLKTAQTAQGTLQNQADIYAESWQAASAHVKAASETIYKNLLDDKFFKGLTNGFGYVLDVVGEMTNSLGGFRGSMLSIANIATQFFRPQITQGLANLGANIQGLTPGGRDKVLDLRRQAMDLVTKDIRFSQYDSVNSLTHSYNKAFNERQVAYDEAVLQGKISQVQQPVYQMLLNNMAQEEQANIAQAEQTASNQIGYTRNYYQALAETNRAIRARQIELSSAPGLDRKTMSLLRERDNAVATGVALSPEKAAQIRALSPSVIQAYDKYQNALNFKATDLTGKIDRYQQEVLSESSLRGVFNTLTRHEGASLLDLDSKDLRIVAKDLQTLAIGAKQSGKELDSVIPGLGQFNASLQGLGKDISSLTDQEIKDLFSGNNSSVLTKAINRYVQEEAMGNKVSEQTRGEIEAEVRQRLGYGANEGNEVISGVVRALTAKGASAEETAAELTRLGISKEKQDELLKGIKGEKAPQTLGLAGTVTSVAGSMAALANTITSVTNAIKTFGDTNATATQKIGALGSVAMSASMAIPQFGNLAKNWGKSVVEGGSLTVGGASLWTLGITAALMAGTAAYKDLHKTSLAGAIENYNTALATSTQLASEAKTAYDNLVVNSSNHNNLLNNLSNLRQGTEEFTLALLQANEAATNIIENHDLIYGQDYTYGANGEITFLPGVMEQTMQNAREEMVQTSIGKQQISYASQILETSVDNATKKAYAGYTPWFLDDKLVHLYDVNTGIITDKTTSLLNVFSDFAAFAEDNSYFDVDGKRVWNPNVSAATYFQNGINSNADLNFVYGYDLNQLYQMAGTNSVEGLGEAFEKMLGYSNGTIELPNGMTTNEAIMSVLNANYISQRQAQNEAAVRGLVAVTAQGAGDLRNKDLITQLVADSLLTNGAATKLMDFTNEAAINNFFGQSKSPKAWYQQLFGESPEDLTDDEIAAKVMEGMLNEVILHGTGSAKLTGAEDFLEGLNFKSIAQVTEELEDLNLPSINNLSYENIDEAFNAGIIKGNNLNENQQKRNEAVSRYADYTRQLFETQYSNLEDAIWNSFVDNAIQGQQLNLAEKGKDSPAFREAVDALYNQFVDDTGVIYQSLTYGALKEAVDAMANANSVGIETGQAMYNMLKDKNNRTSTGGFTTDALAVIRNFNYDNSISGLYANNQLRKWAQNDTQRTLYANLLSQQIKDMQNEKGFFLALYNSSGFSDVMDQLNEQFQQTGAITAQNVTDLAKKSDALAKALELSSDNLEGLNINAGGLASIFTEMSRGTISINELNSQLISSMSTAGESRGATSEAFSVLDNQNLGRSGTELLEYFQNAGKAYYSAQSAGWGFYTEPMQNIVKMFGGKNVQEEYNRIGLETNVSAKEAFKLLPEYFTDFMYTMAGVKKGKAKGGGGPADVVSFIHDMFATELKLDTSSDEFAKEFGFYADANGDFYLDKDQEIGIKEIEARLVKGMIEAGYEEAYAKDFASIFSGMIMTSTHTGPELNRRNAVAGYEELYNGETPQSEADLRAFFNSNYQYLTDQNGNKFTNDDKGFAAFMADYSARGGNTGYSVQRSSDWNITNANDLVAAAQAAGTTYTYQQRIPGAPSNVTQAIESDVTNMKELGMAYGAYDSITKTWDYNQLVKMIESMNGTEADLIEILKESPEEFGDALYGRDKYGNILQKQADETFQEFADRLSAATGTDLVNSRNLTTQGAADVAHGIAALYWRNPNTGELMFDPDGETQKQYEATAREAAGKKGIAENQEKIKNGDYSFLSNEEMNTLINSTAAQLKGKDSSTLTEGQQRYLEIYGEGSNNEKTNQLLAKILLNTDTVIDQTGQIVDATEEGNEDIAQRKATRTNKNGDEEANAVDEEGNPIDLPEEQKAPGEGGWSANSGYAGGGNSRQNKENSKNGLSDNIAKLFGENGTIPDRFGAKDDDGTVKYYQWDSGQNSYVETDANGTVIVGGVASGQNNNLLKFASGKEQGQIAVTGELGPELRVKSDGSMDVLGQHGREYAWVEPDDKIYTAAQTASILGNKKIAELQNFAEGINNFIPGYERGVGADWNNSGGGGTAYAGSSSGGKAEEEDHRYDPQWLQYRDTVERYYTILQQIEDITNAVTRFSEIADRAWGKQRQDALKETIKLQEQQIDAQKKYLSEIRTYFKGDRDTLTTMMKEFVDEYNDALADTPGTLLSFEGAEFDENGVITNYREFAEALIDKFNQDGQLDQKSQYKLQERLKDIQQYTDTLNLLEEQEQQLQKLEEAVFDAKMNEIQVTLDYKLSLSQDQMTLIDYALGKVKDDAYEAARAVAEIGKQQEELMNQLGEYEIAFRDTLHLNFGSDSIGMDLIHEETTDLEQNLKTLEEFKEKFKKADTEDEYEEKATWETIKTDGTTSNVEHNIKEYYDTLLKYYTEYYNKYDELLPNPDDFFIWSDEREHDYDAEKIVLKNEEEVLEKLNYLRDRLKENSIYVDYDEATQQIKNLDAVNESVQKLYDNLVNEYPEITAAIKEINENIIGEDGKINVQNYAYLNKIKEVINEISRGKLSQGQYDSFLSDAKQFFAEMSDLFKNPDFKNLPMAQIEAFRNQLSNILPTLTQLREKSNEIIGYVGDSLKTYFKDINAEIDNFDHVKDLYKDWINILDLTGQTITKIDHQLMSSLQDNLTNNYKKKLMGAHDAYKAAVSYYNTVNQEYLKAQKEFENTDKEAPEYDRLRQTANAWKEQLVQAEKSLEDAENTRMQSLIDLLERLKEEVNEVFKTAAAEFEDTFSPFFHTLDMLQTAFDREQQLQDLYLDAYDQAHDLSKLNRDIQQSIIDTDNLQGKKELKKLMQQINDVQKQGNKLTQYDVDNFQRLYDIELARQALEDARNAKSLVRLARDNNGNWSYVYTANEEDEEEAEQALEDKLNEAAKANEDRIKELSNNFIALQNEFEGNLNSLKDQDLTPEEIAAEAQKFYDAYLQKMQNTTDQLEAAMGNNQGLIDQYGKDYGDLLAGITTDFGGTILSAITGTDNLGDLADRSADSAGTLMERILKVYDDKYQEKKEAWALAELDVDNAAGETTKVIEDLGDRGTEALEKTYAAVDKSAKAFVDLMEKINNADKVLQSFVDTFNEMFNADFSNIDELISHFENLATQITALIQASGEYTDTIGRVKIDGLVDDWDDLSKIYKSLRDNGEAMLQYIDEDGVKQVIDLLAGDEDTNNLFDAWRHGVLGDWDAESWSGRGFDKEKSDIMSKLDKKDTKKIWDYYDELEKEIDYQLLDRLEVADKLYEKLKEKEIEFENEDEENKRATILFDKANNAEYVEEVLTAIKEIMEEALKVVAGGGGGWGSFSLEQYLWDVYNGGNHTGGASDVYHIGSHAERAGVDTGGYTGRWQSADTGMYTGEWPNGSVRSNGRLAWLHQKELVLNAHDTENFLDAMEIVRQLDNLTNWMANGLGDLIMPNVSSEMGELEQNVHIEAEFPNVTDHNEIEQAFNNLVNMASQYANRK